MKDKDPILRRIILPHKTQNDLNRYGTHTYYEVDAPKICPLCGSAAVVGEIPVLNAMDPSAGLINPIFIKVWVCNDHFKFRRISQNQIPKLILIFSIGLIPLLLFHWVALLLVAFGVLIFMVTDIERIEKFSKKFRDRIIFEHFPQHSVISSNQGTWFEKFLERNPGIEFRGDLKHTQKTESRFFWIFFIQILMLWVISWSIIFFIEIGFQNLIIPLIWIILCLLGVFFSTGIYWDIKKVRMKATLYFGNNS